nr:MAG TPA: hypothetical protein [Inoviridae sp.]
MRPSISSAASHTKHGCFCIIPPDLLSHSLTLAEVATVARSLRCSDSRDYAGLPARLRRTKCQFCMVRGWNLYPELDCYKTITKIAVFRWL